MTGRTSSPASTPPPIAREAGFTLIELTIVLAILGVLASLSTVRYMAFVEKARVITAVAELDAMSKHLDDYVASFGHGPPDLDTLNLDGQEDPWGYVYRYYRIRDETGKDHKGGARKDKFLVPINTYYDLYSVGPNGATKIPLKPKDSADDVIRANDGGYYGLAWRF